MAKYNINITIDTDLFSEGTSLTEGIWKDGDHKIDITPILCAMDDTTDLTDYYGRLVGTATRTKVEEKPKTRRYFALFVRWDEDSRWTPEFGSYEYWEVRSERDTEYTDAHETWIANLDDDQHATAKAKLAELNEKLANSPRREIEPDGAEWADDEDLKQAGYNVQYID
jgi:hypothetical protein